VRGVVYTGQFTVTAVVRQCIEERYQQDGPSGNDTFRSGDVFNSMALSTGAGGEDLESL